MNQYVSVYYDPSGRRTAAYNQANVTGPRRIVAVADGH
jgi:hypothetical protein